MNRIICITVLLGLIWQGCLTDPDCVTTTENFVSANFYDIESLERDTLFFNSVKAIGSDSIIVMNQQILGLTLPLDPGSTSVTYVFESPLSIDTVILSYNLGTRLISEDCGLEFVFTGLGYVRSDFDSISIVNEIPLEGVTEDIRIYN